MRRFDAAIPLARISMACVPFVSFLIAFTNRSYWFLLAQFPVLIGGFVLFWIHVAGQTRTKTLSLR